MVILNIAILLAACLLGILPFLLTWRLKRRLSQSTPRAALPSQADYLPRTTMVLPCKGLDPGFRENIEALLEQDYPTLELLFVVAEADDPAFGALQDLLAQSLAKRGATNARVLIAGLSMGRAQKLTNQLAAVHLAAPQTEVLVFVDSDCRPDPMFLRRLVQPLRSSAIGATTGYRWYHPPSPTLGSLLRSTWNAGALPFLIDPKRVFAWGGAMAIRKETFERAQIADKWNHAVSDDMTLTVAVRDMGLELQFVTDCIAVSYESSTLAETLEFTNRQSLISRVYFPPLWWGTAIGHALANVLILWGIVNLFLWLSDRTPSHGLGAFCALLLPLQLLNAAWMFGAAKSLLPPVVRDELQALRWHYVFTAPLASMMTLVNTVHSVFTRRIRWRGIVYELRSPHETVVVSESSSG